MPLHPILQQITTRIARRSHASRVAYLDRIDQARDKGPHRKRL